MNKVARLTEFAGPGMISILNEEIPTPGKGEVLVKMKTAGLNHVDKMIMYGHFPVKPEIPATIGFEGAGIIEQVGADVSGIHKGDEVSILPNMAFDKYGVIADYAVVPSESIIAKPERFTWLEASAMWMGFGTAYQGLVNAGGLKEGGNQTVLISAASSSVGLPAIQIAKRHGATVIATSRSLAKETSIKEAGADYVLATRDENWKEEITEITSGRGFDISFDPIAGSFTSDLADAAGFGATLVTYGIMNFGEPALIPLFPMMNKSLKITGLSAGHHLFGTPKNLSIFSQHLVENAENGSYRAMIDSVFKLSETVEAYQRMESGNQIGKIMIDIDG